MTDYCETCKGDDYIECRQCGAHFRTVLVDHGELCCDCRRSA